VTRRRALLVAPGRGSYERTSLGGLAGRSDAAAAWVARADAWRRATGRPTVSELDASPWSLRHHVAGEHASLLTAAASWADAADLDTERYEVVGVTGNSMGWYTALGLAGALPPDDAVRLVDTMGVWQEGNVVGGQILYPVSGEDWHADPRAEEVVEAALIAAREAGHAACHSIRLVGHAVLGADAGGLRALMASLPPVERGPRTFPIQLPLHSAFHTPLMAPTSERARRELGGLAWTAPSVPLVDGTGRCHWPRWASTTALADWTLGAQITECFDLGRALRSALRHTAPDVVVALGPGNALGGPIARAIVGEGWRGIRSRVAFEAAVRSEDPPVLAFGIKPQRARLVRAE
jgi:acyl transferase domain-containing protein